MPRSTIAQQVQIGKETTPGTAVAASRRLQGLSIALSPDVESEAFRPRGVKYPTVVAANKEWSSGDLEGVPNYDEIVVPLASVMGTPTVSQIMDGATPTGAYTWTFSPVSSGADTPVTFTVEQGDTTAAQRATHALFTDFGMEFSRDSVSASGSLIARSLETLASLPVAGSPAPYSANLVPILPGQVSLFVGDTAAALDTPANKITNGLSVSPSIGGRYNPAWYLNAADASFGSYTEAPEPDATVDLTVEANAAGLAWAGLFRTGATKFLRIQAEGATIYTGTVSPKYLFQWDLAVKVLEPGELADEDGLYALSPSLQIVHDPTWGKAMSVKVVNKVQAL